MRSRKKLKAEIEKLHDEIALLKNQSINNPIPDSTLNSHDLFYSIFEEAGIGMAIINKNAHIIKFNKSFKNLFDYSNDELFAKTYFDLIPDNKKNKAHQFIEAMFNAKLNKYEAEQPYLKSDGSIIWLKLTASIIKNPDGRAEYILGMGEDITELKKAEVIKDAVYNISNAVSNSYNLYTLIETIKDNLSEIIDSKHFFIAIYNEFEDSFSIPCLADNKEIFKTFSAKNTLPGYVLRKKKSILLNHKELVDLQNSDNIFIEGKVCKQWLGIPLINQEKCIGVIGVQSFESEIAFNHNDLTILEILSNQISDAIQKMRTEDALKVERAYFKELFDNSPEAIAIVDNSSKIININKEFSELFGYTKSEAINQSIEDLISTPAYKEEAHNLTTEIAVRKKTVKIDTKRRKKDGSMVEVSLWGTPIILDKGQIAVYAIFRDITERVEAKKKLEEAKDKAEESDRLKTSFLTNMSHEIRTPMNAIVGFSELIAEPSTDKESRKEFAEQIYASSKMLLKLIDDIIDISQLDSTNLKLNIKKTNLSKLLSDVHSKFLKEKIKENKNEIELLLHNPFGDLTTYIETDEFRFKQIFNNLLNNALKYTEQGFIEFGFDVNQNDEPIFYVRDTGIGIPADKIDSIFNHFTKIEDRRKLYRGTGIGLTITKKLVSLLGGEIWVESNVGIGSIFYFTISEKVSFVKLKKGSTDKKSYNWAGKNIMVAEDDDTNYQVIKASLSRTHANLVRVHNGEKAVNECLSNNFDLIIMDIKMPNLDGIEATKRIRFTNQKIPIIAQTAFFLKNERDTCIDAGCNDYIPKPVNSRKLLETIDKYFINGN